MMRVLNMAAAPRRSKPDHQTAYVALGDSMSIDDYAGGPGCGAASLLFRNRDADFPEWAGRDLQMRLRSRGGAIDSATSFVSLATDGATSAAVRYVQLPRLIERNIRPAVVTLTMGGNDLLQTFGRYDAARDAHIALQEHGTAALAAIRRLALPNAPVVVSTIYDPSDGSGDGDALGIAVSQDALGWLECFNDTLCTLAARYDAAVADLHAAFRGHGLSTGVSPAQTGPRPEDRRLYYCGGVEPNAWGASAIRSEWWHALPPM
jgi:lysophospholipase L1-like esterase